MSRVRWFGALAAALSILAFGGCGSGRPADTALGAHDTPGRMVVISEDADAMEEAPIGRSPGAVVPGRYIIVLKDGVSPTAVARDHRVKPDQVYLSPGGFAGRASPAQARALREDARVRLVQPDRIITLVEPGPVIPFARGGKKGGTLPPETLPTGVNRIDAEVNGVPANLNPSGGAADPTIAIIDTGVGPHDELNVVLWGSVFRRKFYDDNGHGTHVAGIAAARANATGVRGVAPNARLISIKVLDASGSGYLSWIYSGINWITQNADKYNIRVANMSLGFGGYDLITDWYIQASIDAGVTYVVAAGNSDASASDFCPANVPRVIAVSAMADYNGDYGGGTEPPTARADWGPDDTLATFSNWFDDPQILAMAAPGVWILSTYLNGGYAYMSGTSMASPHVAGAALQYIASHPVGSYPAPASVAERLRLTGWPQSADEGFDHLGKPGAEPLTCLPRLLDPNL